MSTTANFSDLLRHPNDVLERLDEGDVVLTRRGAEPLRLVKERDAEQEHEMVGAIAHLISSAAGDDDATDRLAEHLLAPFPWIEFLGLDDRRHFVGDFLRTARACAAIARFDRLAIVVANWRETATAYSLGLDRSLTELDHLSERVTAEKPRAS